VVAASCATLAVRFRPLVGHAVTTTAQVAITS
jgi:hypothetical protein